MDFLVTIRAILEYLDKANQAQEKLEEAGAKMDSAAAALLDQWEGEAADAFRQEQETLKGFLSSLMNVGRNFMQVVRTVANKYEAIEESNRGKFQI